MIDNDLIESVSEMSVGDCVALSRLLRKRLGHLARIPPPEILMECRAGRTAAVTVFGDRAVGRIESIENNCVLMRFADQNTLLVPIALLHPDGFDADITVARQLNTLPSATDVEHVSGAVCPVLYAGSLYLLEREGELFSEIRQVLRSVVPEHVPTSDLIEMLPAGGVGDVHEDDGVVVLCL